MAARLYWSLKVFGAGELAILDGGDAGWLAAGQAQDAERAAKKEARTKARGKGTGRRDPQSGDAASE